VTTHRIYKWQRPDRRNAAHRWYGEYADIANVSDQSWTQLLYHYRWLRESGLHKHAARLVWWNSNIDAPLPHTAGNIQEVAA
jgi:hypothetical protein